MRYFIPLVLCASSQAGAGGLDASGQSTAFLFREGTVVELGFGRVVTTVSGQDAPFLGGSETGDIADDTFLPSFSIKHDLNDRVSVALILERPFFGGVSFGPSSIGFGGTESGAETVSLTDLLQYHLTEAFSVFGGPRVQWVEADFELEGALYGPAAGYRADLDRNSAVGYVLGVAYELPEHALRVSLTYNSEIEHTFSTTEVLGLQTRTSEIEASTPQSVNLEFTSGVAPKTFVFGGVRRAEWSELQIAPPLLSAPSPDPLVDFNDTSTYTLGVGRQFTDYLIGTAALIYEPSTDPLTTPLTPKDGFQGVSVGAIHQNGNTEFHMSMTYLQVGDTAPYVGALGREVSSFSGNSSLGLGLKLVQRF